MAGTTVEERLLDTCAWVADALVGRAPLPTEADVEARLHPEFLAAVPPAQFLAIVRSTRSEIGDAEVTAPVTSGTGATFTIGGAAALDVQLAIEPSAPHRIVSLLLKPSEQVGESVQTRAQAALDWAVAALTGAAPLPSEEELGRWIKPAWLADLGASPFIDGIHATAAVLTPESPVRTEIAGAKASFLLGEGPTAVIGFIQVSVTPPHDVIGFGWDSLPEDARPTVRPEDAPRRRRSSLPDDLAAQLDDIGRRLHAETGAPAAVLVVARDGEIVYVDGRGEPWIGAGVAPDEHTPFRIGSVSKVVTACAVLRQVRAGKMDLDAPLTTALPWLVVRPVGGGAVPTLRHILTQTSGLQRDLPSVRSETDLRALLTDGIDMVATPGTVEAYSNLGFGLLGLALEEVTGRTYADLVGDEMPGATATIGAPPSPPAPIGYEVRVGLATPAGLQEIPDQGAGAVLASAAQLVAFGERILEDHELTAPQDLPSRHALAIVRIGKPDDPVYWHNGGLLGWRSSFFVHPRLHVTVVALTNIHDDRVDTLASDALKVMSL